MGRALGAFDPDDDVLDRPDLNQCPDCGCYFASDCCPLCGKECPEAYRAGHRKAVRQSKQYWRKSERRPAFVEWYHSWWFMLLMLFVSPVISLILLITSPHPKKKKWIAGGALALLTVLSFVGIGNIVAMVGGIWNRPVDTSLSRAEYVTACQEMTPEAVYRGADSLSGKFVCVRLVVVERVEDVEGYGGKYNTYYLCRDAQEGDVQLLLRDCIQDTPQNLLPGDTITVYGEIDGIKTVYNMQYTPYTAPCVNMAYLDFTP